MSTAAEAGAPHHGAHAGLSPVLIFACAIACGAMVANLYYAQPLVDLISPELHLDGSIGGLIVTVTQLGYGLGLLLLVSLADLVENRQLIVTTLCLASAALIALGFAWSAPVYLAGSAIVGFCSAGAQIVVPYAASLAPEATRGRTIGNVMAGLLAGIMLARPVASMIADLAGWRWVFFLSAALMLLLAVWLARALPKRKPKAQESYGEILRSLGTILATTPVLRRRALYQGVVFAVFNMFWTAVPLVLARSFGYSQRGIALFALAGAGGALAAPFAGRLGDKGYARAGTAGALIVVALSAVLSGWAAAIGSVALLVVFAIALDAAAQTNQVLTQRVIYALSAEKRGRLNALYMTIVFAFGAAGSFVATVTFHNGGWWTTTLTGAVLVALALAFFFGAEFRGRR